MNQKNHLISSIISMVLTSVLLIFVCLAWYTNNKVANAGGAGGNITESSNLIESVEYYNISQITEDGVITISTEISSNTFELGTYNPLSSTYPQKLMVINLKTVKDSNGYIIPVTDGLTIEAISYAENYLGATIKDDNGDFILQKTSENSLSSVIGFYFLSEVDMEAGTAQLSDEEVYFADINKNAINNTLVVGSASNLVSTKTTQLFVLIDYYQESIEHIYSLNIGNEALNPSTDSESTDSHKDDIKYTCDFNFRFKGVA